ncbi:MAG: EVE domain-containing protein [Phycisphaerae bacterium]
MANWLLKTEPGTYSFADLQKAKTAVWDGVTNALALKHLRAMKVGDEVLIYHTGSEKAVVGQARVVAGPQADPKDAKLVVVTLSAGPALAHPVTLATMKTLPTLAGFDLLRLPRLSVIPVTPAHWQVIVSLAK